MRTEVLIVVSAVIVPVILAENRTNYLRNFYTTYEEHERSLGQFSVENERIRHKHGERKINKVKRCRRYAQYYYQQRFVPNNCYYNVCRQNYCGYCPTSSCRRRCCPQFPSPGTTPPRITASTVPPKECKCDKHGSKIQACDQNTGKCICKPHYEGSKCDRCEAGHYKSKSTCTPCNCNYNGSTSLNCDPETGMCPCKPGVQGQKCDSCQEKHYGSVSTGCKACDPCDNEGHICHPGNGKCVCPELTEGGKCQVCVENSWGHEPGIGCKPCGCSVAGSSSAQCDAVTGACICKVGFEGGKCDKCSFGYHNYPQCRKCKCAVAGTVPEDCSHGICKCSQNGCRCKPNVEGPHCNRCKKGTFGLDPDHPSGCISCFCSNRSTTCSASTFIWDQIRTNAPNPLNPQQCINRLNCYSLPKKFHGDLIQSYGGYLRISSNSPKNSIYLTGNDITLESVTDPSGDVKIAETYWKLKYESDQIRIPDVCSFHRLTRGCLMVVLQNVSGIQIEPRHGSAGIKFNEVLLDKTSNIVGIPQAKSVENCTCPKEYSSSSCQDPNMGYYRHRPKDNEPGYTDIDRVFGVARPCQCHNRSNTCDKETGHCYDCQYFTTGPNCNSCAEGYYKNRKGNCSPCLCPSEQQNFAVSCVVDDGLKCYCKRGYSGDDCSQCEDNYWGNPQEVGGLCQPCNCNPHGSERLRCDKTTGYCACKSGFTGEKCSKCEKPREVIQEGVCVPCDECTQILFHTIDDLSDDLENTLELFKNGLGPPWRLLNTTISRHNALSDDFDRLRKAQSIVDNANIPDLEQRIQSLDNNLIVQDQELTKQVRAIDDIHSHTQNQSQEIGKLQDKINELIRNSDQFGKSHVDVNVALREAEELLKEITDISKETPTVQHYQDFFNTCQNFSTQVNTIYDDFDPSPIKRDLANLRNRIRQLNNELHQTDTLNKLATGKNKRNSLRIDELKRKIAELNQTTSNINDDLSRQLKKINATFGLLRDMKTIYELLSQLDLEGATEDLEQDDFEDIYEKLSLVREHVKNLQDAIKTYKDIFNFTPDEWTKIDASGAYDTIVKEIHKARNEANEAKNAIEKALARLYPSGEDSLPDKTSLAKAFSDRIEKRVKNLDNLTKDFKTTTEELEELKHNILGNGKNNNKLNSLLHDILRNITQHSKDIDDLEKAEKDARNVSGLIMSIEQGLKDTNITVQYDLIKTYEKYQDLLSGSEIEALNKTIADTKRQLDKINVNIRPTTYDNITHANHDRFESTKKKLDEMKMQIDNLANKIQHANEKVEAVEYGVNLTNCQRHYKLKDDIFRSLRVHFKCKSCVLVNLANNRKDTVKIYYEDNQVTVDWKNQTVRIGAKNSVSVERIGSTTIQIKSDTNTEYITDEEPFKIDGSNLLQVGASANASVRNVEACLHKVILNERTVGLWKFYRSEGNCSGCYRNNTNNDGLVNAFFNGHGYRQALDHFTPGSPSQFSFKFTFATFDENSLIFLAQEKVNQCSFIALNLKNGYLQLNIQLIKGDPVQITSEKQYNNGSPTIADITIIYDSLNNYTLLMTLTQTKSGYKENPTRSIDIERSSLFKIKKSNIFVGGISSTLNTSCLPVNTTSFVGNLAVSVPQINNQNSFSASIEPQRLKLDFPQAWFPGNGYLDVELNVTKDRQAPNATFIVQPVNVDSSFIMNINNILDIYLENSNLTFKLKNGSEVEFGSMVANEYHFVYLNSSGVKVDGVYQSLGLKRLFKGVNELHLGNHVTNKIPSFVGSIGDIFFDNRPVLFNDETVKSFKNVEIGRDHQVPSSHTEGKKEMQNTERYSNIPDYRTEPQAFKFGDKPNSFVSIKNNFLGKKFILEFQFRTFYPNGLLFLANSPLSNKNTTLFTTLEIQGGDLRLQVQGHKTKTMNAKNRFNDGMWHHVQVEQILGKKKWRLVVKVDKKWKLKERLPRNSFNGELYLGGAPHSLPIYKKLKSELHPFRGCIRSLKINKNPQVVKNNNNVIYNNIGQCFQNVEEGAYFGGDAFAIYKYGFKVNKFLELSFEFKTGEPNGILLSVSNPGNSPALSVELQNGAVVMTIDMGNSIVSQVTNSPHADSSLANNEWHNITALYSSSELTVNVDGVRKSWVQSDINSMMDEIEAPLYVGGLPRNAPSGTLKIKENFKGCIRKFKIEDNIMDWTDMKKLNNVQLNSCLA